MNSTPPSNFPTWVKFPHVLQGAPESLAHVSALLLAKQLPIITLLGPGIGWMTPVIVLASVMRFEAAWPQSEKKFL
jgi:hypothetical protein